MTRTAAPWYAGRTCGPYQIVGHETAPPASLSTRTTRSAQMMAFGAAATTVPVGERIDQHRRARRLAKIRRRAAVVAQRRAALEHHPRLDDGVVEDDILAEENP